MTDSIPQIGSLRELQEEAGRSATAIVAACDELLTAFVETSTRVAQSAGLVADAVAQREVRPQPVPYDLSELLSLLERSGPHALTTRERKALIASRERLSAKHLGLLLESHPALQGYAARMCFAHWPHYVRDPWGPAYESALRPHVAQMKVTVANASGIPLSRLLTRRVPGAEAELAARLPAASLIDAYERVRSGFGIRESWLLCACVLSAWLKSRLQRGVSLDDPCRQLFENQRLRALLLPLPKNESPPAVRSTVEIQAQTVATFLAAAYSVPPRLSRAVLSTLTDQLVKSNFGDPRAPLRSDGWREVNRLYEEGFRRLLTSLCEQDLEVFFKHAMREPDRHKFWLRYLPSLERTGCVLDHKLRKLLDARLANSPELHSALERAHTFSGNSDVQAFYLVFSKFVVVEFSHTGNAAYVYKREFLEKMVEPYIRSGQVRNVAELKVHDRLVHRVLHTPGWQDKTKSWLAEHGIHPRDR